jgi:hypothetical protein
MPNDPKQESNSAEFKKIRVLFMRKLQAQEPYHPWVTMWHKERVEEAFLIISGLTDDTPCECRGDNRCLACQAAQWKERLI